MDRSAVEWIANSIVAAIGRDEAVAAQSLLFLLRYYRDTNRSDVREALEAALACAVERHTDAVTATARASWLLVFADAATLSDDDRLRSAAIALVGALRQEWKHTHLVGEGAVVIESLLAAAQPLDLAALVPEAIDELERIVAGAYRPGEGLASVLNESSSARGRLVDHIRGSSALLSAYQLTGRLPYSMLAEELMQFAHRTFWREPVAAFCDAGIDRGESFLLNCEGARVLSRLAGLHLDDEYRKAAVVAKTADYAHDAARILNAHAAWYREPWVQSSAYGLALIECFGLT
ncbi:MAG: hypothetical protein C5B57_00665 [Blastocatellia bacterium]|nr:MAG: hypothetical protein C5B57_00665 [Blastocatellia bacterium]